ncbi:capsule assembly Wzi family protein, partial [bacterium]|nr:capsule assembly Wzi family protein [bacterium]
IVERLEAKGLITGVLNGTKPYSREEMVRYLLQVEAKVKNGYVLSSTESQQLEFLRFEFKEEFEQLTGSNGHHFVSRLQKIKEHKVVGKMFPGFVYKNNRNLFAVEAPGFKLFADPIFYHKFEYANPDSIDHTDRVFERTHGLTLWGQLGTHMAFYFDFRDTKEWGSRTYPNQTDISIQGLGFVNGYGSHIWHDETIAYLVFKLPYIQLVLGKNSNYWGPGFNGALSLSNNATSYDQIKLQARFWRLKFTYLWGFLRTFPAILDVDGGSKPKNIVAHRLEIDVARWLDIGMYETVIFGNRRFELAYVNPINFYRSAEHFVSDDDNASIGIDIELLPIPNIKLYGELFIDDLNTGRLGGDFFGNKTGLLVGGYWVDMIGISNLDARLEYARTRPYLYTHRNEINKFAHFNTGLGHWIGPNSDIFNARLQYRVSKSFVFAATFEKFRHGENKPGRNVGGDINQPFIESDSRTAVFLDGIVTRRTYFGIEASYELYRNFYFGLNLRTIASRNVVLPGLQRGPVDRNEIFITIALNR